MPTEDDITIDISEIQQLLYSLKKINSDLISELRSLNPTAAEKLANGIKEQIHVLSPQNARIVSRVVDQLEGKDIQLQSPTLN